MEKHVRLVYPGTVRKAKEAVKKANEILGNPEFYDQIRGYRTFDTTDLSPEVIAGMMEDGDHRITVDLSVLILNTKAASSSPERITLSYWNFSTHLPSAVNTLIHETVNAMDRFRNQAKNKPLENRPQPTAPWVIGAIAEIMVK